MKPSELKKLLQEMLEAVDDAPPVDPLAEALDRKLSTGLNDESLADGLKAKLGIREDTK